MAGTAGRFDGKVAVVTGGASGIGLAVAGRLGADGARVVVADLTEQEAGSLPDGCVAAVQCDVRQEADLARLMAEADRWGGVDILVNSAGVTSKAPIDEMPLEQWSRVLEVNLTGSAMAIKHAVPRMKASGAGAIVNIASVSAYSTMSPFNSAYAASKGGVVALTRALVYELSPAGIRVNAVAPGLVDTPILSGHDDQWRRTRERRVPLARFSETAEIAAVTAFLASDEAGYITGQTVIADGGITSIIYVPD